MTGDATLMRLRWGGRPEHVHDLPGTPSKHEVFTVSADDRRVGVGLPAYGPTPTGPGLATANLMVELSGQGIGSWPADLVAPYSSRPVISSRSVRLGLRSGPGEAPASPQLYGWVNFSLNKRKRVAIAKHRAKRKKTKARATAVR